MSGAKQSQFCLYLPNTDQQFTSMELFTPTGRTDIIEQFGTRKVVYVDGVDQTFIPYTTEEEPPGDSPSFDLSYFQDDQLKYIEKIANRGGTLNAQLRLYLCASKDNPTAWDRIWQLSGIKPSQRVVGAGPSLRANGTLVESNASCPMLAMIDVLKLDLSAFTSAETEDALSIDGLKDLSTGCGVGYPGPDKVLVIGCQSAAGPATANMYFTIDGGSNWTIFTNDPGAADEHLGAIQIRPLGTGFRVIVARTMTDAAAPAEAWYGTSTAFDATTIAAVTWTAVNIGSTNGEFVSALGLAWLEFNRLYAGLNSGDIYVSTNQGESYSLLFNGSQAVAQFARDADGNVWAVAATNTILFENANNRGAFSAKTGPAGGGAFTAIAIANDGTIFAGNGTSIFRNNNNALTAGGWSSLKDFGASHAVKRIWFEGENKLANGDSQIIYAVVDDSSPNDGAVWRSVDWGQSWQQITNLANDGYNDAYHSKFGNHAVIVGDDNPLAVIQLLSQA